MLDFKAFPKIARLSREVIVTEKIDGTNAQIYIGEDGEFLAGSRTRWITPEADNFGFARWAEQNKEELLKLGPGHHFGEWWGVGIQRGYSLSERRFSLFNVSKWSDPKIRPFCCSVVPTIGMFEFNSLIIDECLQQLREKGSWASPGFANPEGIIVFHVQNGVMFKKTFKDEHKEMIH